jgi:Fur family transcriptional regulator, peroxide stress response regulator
MVSESRTTKYSVAVTKYLADHGHATNTELVYELRKFWPDLSATTVHRVTSRLAEQGQIGIAPKDSNGNLRYDANTKLHHHFYCACCDVLRDIELDKELLNKIEVNLGGCTLNGQLLINGACDKCFIKQQSRSKL